MSGKFPEYFTDGSAIPNPGQGGFAVVLENKVIISGALTRSTNNEAEMFAVLTLVRYLEPQSVTLVWIDSRLVLGWLTKNWKCANANIARMRGEIFDLMIKKSLIIYFNKVKGHANTFGNNLADREAKRMARYGKPEEVIYRELQS